jgi:hypothetical protein
LNEIIPIANATLVTRKAAGFKLAHCNTLKINPLNAELNPIRHLLALAGENHFVDVSRIRVNPLKTQLNPIRHFLALAGAHHFVDVSTIRVNPLNAELNPIR